MEKITCRLECDHEIEWTDRPIDPGADLPFAGRVVYCEKCGADKEIVECWPIKPVAVEVQMDDSDTKETFLTVFWDTEVASWGFCFQGITADGLGFDDEDSAGYESPEDAETAGCEAFAELKMKREEMREEIFVRYLKLDKDVRSIVFPELFGRMVYLANAGTKADRVAAERFFLLAAQAMDSVTE